MEASLAPEESLASPWPTTPSLKPPLLCMLSTEHVPGALGLRQQHASPGSSSGPMLVRPECEVIGVKAGVWTIFWE